MQTVVVQQPQFLPWAGLWHKFVSADVYVLYAGVKFDQGGHTHRVTVHNSWITAPIEKGQRSGLIKDVRMAENYRFGLDKMARTIRQSCAGKRYPHRDRLDGVITTLEKWEGEFLLDLSMALFWEMRAALNLTDVVVKIDDKVRDLERIGKLDACLKEYMGDAPFIYLSGAAGLNYLSYDSLKAPVECRFQQTHPGVSPDSVLQLIASCDDPLETIRACAHWVSKDGTRHEWNSR